jgi:hypothetical protein
MITMADYFSWYHETAELLDTFDESTLMERTNRAMGMLSELIPDDEIGVFMEPWVMLLMSIRQRDEQRSQDLLTISAMLSETE